MTKMTEKTLTDLTRETASVLATVDSGPVVITKHGLDAYVVLKADEYRYLIGRARRDG